MNDATISVPTPSSSASSFVISSILEVHPVLEWIPGFAAASSPVGLRLCMYVSVLHPSFSSSCHSIVVVCVNAVPLNEVCRFVFTTCVWLVYCENDYEKAYVRVSIQ